METMNVTLEVPKDFKEVVDLTAGIIEKVKSKADFNSYMELIDELTAAADGVQNVLPAVQGEYRDECAGYLVKTLMASLAPVGQPEEGE